jgi:hypothetical protein
MRATRSSSSTLALASAYDMAYLLCATFLLASAVTVIIALVVIAVVVRLVAGTITLLPRTLLRRFLRFRGRSRHRLVRSGSSTGCLTHVAAANATTGTSSGATTAAAATTTGTSGSNAAAATTTTTVASCRSRHWNEVVHRLRVLLPKRTKRVGDLGSRRCAGCCGSRRVQTLQRHHMTMPTPAAPS